MKENSPDVRRNMLAALIHRGPDDFGEFTSDEIWLGFRRLSIIDLASGNQPNFNEDETITSICNGEIYNYKELREDLCKRGHSFKTTCDVEVIVHLYEEYGSDFFRVLNGQFAIALYDKRKKKLLLARDHAGICPLFYSTFDDHLIFASEIKSILCYPGVPKEVNLEGLDQVFCLPGLCSPVTMFKGIHALRPGHFLELENGKLSDYEYWDLCFPVEEKSNQSEKILAEELEHVFEQSIKYRLNADVEVGLYLSGGLDSSIIAATCNKIRPDSKRKSFGITFNQNNYDESHFQRMVAKSSNISHIETLFDTDDIASRLKNMVLAAESPLKETYNTCSLALSENVKKNNIKVVLTGEGSDELFAGYVGYKLDRHRDKLSSELGINEIGLERELRQLVWGDRNFQFERNLIPFRSIQKDIYSKTLNERFHHFNCLHENLVDKKKLEGRTFLKKRSYLDFKLRLSDHLLADHGDRVSYANSVEARYPFLDIKVIELATKIPDTAKLKGDTEKYILREAFKNILPREILNREKFGFVAPGSRFLMKKNISWINDVLSYNEIKKQGYFDPNMVELLKAQYRDYNSVINETFEIDLLMIILTFGLFLHLFDMPPLS
jgi:asparagine synthase (glutamine-hydrolysing)